MREPRIYRDPSGRFWGTIAESEKLEDELCDFCARKNPPYKIYPCKDFPHPDDPTYWSRGEWNACHVCAALIDANDREGLAVRSASLFALETGEYPIDGLRRFHAGFFKNRECCNEPRGFVGGVCDNCGGTVQPEEKHV